jgi:hypothetical protein
VYTRAIVSFLNPLMLAGVAGALLPLVLHLLSRARYRSVDWGAMMFLDGAHPRDRQSARMKQHALLALRMLIVALLAITLARPIAGGTWAALAPDGPTTAVLVLDCSASMGTLDGGRTRMEAARDVALGLLGNLQPGDRVALVLAGAPGEAADAVPTSDARTVAARIAAARPGHGRVDFAQELTRAASIVNHDTRAGNGRVFVVTDRQALSWSDVTGPFATAWRAGFGTVDAVGGVTVFPVGSDVADNLFIESVRLVNAPAIVGEQADVEVRVRHIGAAAQPTVPVTLRRDGRDVATETVAAAPGSVATARFRVRFEQAGSQLIEARLTSTGLTSDDLLQATVDVVPPLRVLLVSGDEREEDVAAAESIFFRTAAAPYAAAGKKGGVDPAVVTVMHAEAFEPAALRETDVLVLANVGQLSSAMVKAIEQFAYEGGGLLLAPGGLVDSPHYNAMLWRDGAGILPAQMRPPTSVGGGEATSILGVDFNHPAMAFLRGRPDPIPDVGISRYFPVVPRQPDAVVAATYASGRPFYVEAAWGRGRVALLTIPVDADWSALPLSGFYVPFVQSTLRHLSASDAARNLLPGAPIIAVIDDPIDGDVALRLPGGQEAKPAVYGTGGRTEVRFDDTTMPGLYSMRYRTKNEDRTVHFVVRPPRDESDLTPLSAQRWEEIATALGAMRVESGDRVPVLAATFGQGGGRELWGPLIAMTFVALMAELLLARRWSIGPVR